MVVFEHYIPTAQENLPDDFKWVQDFQRQQKVTEQLGGMGYPHSFEISQRAQNLISNTKLSEIWCLFT